MGLRNARLNFRQMEPTHIQENVLYNELAGRGWSVDVGVVEERQGNTRQAKEIDFVVNDIDKRIYIQSALRMEEPEKAAAEIGSLKLTGDFFKKIVIRNDIPASFYDNDGILHASLADFLLDRIELF